MTLTREDSANLWMATAIQGRQHVGPKHLVAPGPSRTDIMDLFQNAAAAPDHDQLRPWRFIVIGDTARETLAQAFADALLERDAKASPEQLHDARSKAFRGPCLILAVVDLRDPNPAVPDAEKILSLGCAVQNLLLSAQALGYASGLTSGKALSSRAFRKAFDVQEGEHAVCFISLGTLAKQRPRKPRPHPDDFVTWR